MNYYQKKSHKNNNFYGDVDTKKFTSLIPCADSDDEMNNLNDTETENKISALKKWLKKKKRLSNEPILLPSIS